MSDPGSITHWVNQLRAGDREGAQALWYYRRLVGLVYQKLKDNPRVRGQEEDVVQMSFASFFKGLEEGRFPQLADRSDLWHLLVAITEHKAAHLVEAGERRKRGGKVHVVCIHSGIDDQLGRLVSREPSPEFAAQLADNYRRLAELLDSDELRQVLFLKMEGNSNQEIAKKLDCSKRTIERRLSVIRALWEKQLQPQ